LLEVTTVADNEAVLHEDGYPLRVLDLEADTDYTVRGRTFRTLARPAGELLATFATVNDVHFGEVECGVLEGLGALSGPILRSGEGEAPYPEMMNRAAIEEIARIEPAVVVAKGDLTCDGLPEEFDSFDSHYASAFGDRLVVVRGNHDAHRGLDTASGDHVRDIEGARLIVLDTVIPGRATGTLSVDQLAWLDEAAANADRPVLVFGHHHIWPPTSARRDPDYFGLDPDASDALIDVVARRRSILGYFAGHTHRNRVRRFASATGDVPFVEVACVKDFPGSWAEYRVYEGGVMQVHRRISSADALSWSERCRVLYSGATGFDYVSYALGTLPDRCFAIGLRG
jgi:3',5'-cyclic-AMP phosphodiesterase